MKKYEKPFIEEEKVVIEDIIAVSGLGSLPGDLEQSWPFGN